MASTRNQDILLPSDDEVTAPVRTRIAAFVPIALAILGVAAIILGRVTVAEVAASEAQGSIGPVATGFIEASSPAVAD